MNQLALWTALVAGLLVPVRTAPQSGTPPRDVHAYMVTGDKPGTFVVNVAASPDGAPIAAADLQFDVRDDATSRVHSNVPFRLDGERREVAPIEQRSVFTVALNVIPFGPGFHTLTVRVPRPSDMVSIPLETYVPGDDALALSRAYAGKRLWTYGPQTLHCVPSGPATIVFVLRPGSPVKIARIGRGDIPQMLGSTYDNAFQFAAIRPLAIVLDPSVQPAIAGMGISEPARTGAANPPHPTPPPPIPQRVCAGAMYASDRWDLERAFSTRPPRVKPSQRVTPGMTHEDVAFLLGFPPGNQTLGELLRAVLWRYPAPAPFDSSVTFKGDRVVKYDPPGELP